MLVVTKHCLQVAFPLRRSLVMGLDGRVQASAQVLGDALELIVAFVEFGDVVLGSVDKLGVIVLALRCGHRHQSRVGLHVGADPPPQTKRMWHDVDVA